MLDRGDLKETAKLLTRRAAGRAGLDVVGDPFLSRVARLCAAAGIETVLDVGANVGQYARLLRAHGFGGTIHSFEPLSTAHDKLARRSAGDGAWSAHRTAIGAEAGRMTLHVAGNSYSSSLLDMAETHVRADPSSAYAGEESVAVSTVAAEVGRLGIEPARTLLKIDTQGYEAEVLAGTDEVLPQLAAVQTELSLVELYVGQPLAGEVTSTLREAGFGLWCFEPGIADDQGRLLQCDAVFVNRAGGLGGAVLDAPPF